MKLFKMKSLLGDRFRHVLDMMIFERLYLSTHHPMNDIEEGGWGHNLEVNRHYIDIAKQVRQIVDKVRFTSFLESINNPLMWAHYAGGFRGVALEYDLDPDTYDIRQIEYNGTPKLSAELLEQIAKGEILPQDAGILRSKSECWKYENEWRLYGNNNDEYLTSTKPEALIFGINGEYIDYDLLREIAEKFEIKMGYLNPTNGTDYEIVYV